MCPSTPLRLFIQSITSSCELELRARFEIAVVWRLVIFYIAENAGGRWLLGLSTREHTPVGLKFK